MKALSLTQPWATLVAIGAKRYETRDWRTAYRGTIAIHAAKNMPRTAADLCMEEPFRGALRAAGYQLPADLPRGCLVGAADIFDCIPAEEAEAYLQLMDGTELAFGDYRPGRWAWKLANAWAFKQPVPCRGNVNLWEIPAEVWQQCTCNG